MKKQISIEKHGAGYRLTSVVEEDHDEASLKQRYREVLALLGANEQQKKRLLEAEGALLSQKAQIEGLLGGKVGKG